MTFRVQLVHMSCGREVGAGNYDKDLFFSLMLNHLLSRKESLHR